MMMATGLRIGETAAITWPALDLEGTRSRFAEM
jgi:integrase